MKNIDEFLEEELGDTINDHTIEMTVDSIRSLLMNWTAQMIINQEEED
jgi:hypothetical protein